MSAFVNSHNLESPFCFCKLLTLETSAFKIHYCCLFTFINFINCKLIIINSWENKNFWIEQWRFELCRGHCVLFFKYIFFIKLLKKQIQHRYMNTWMFCRHFIPRLPFSTQQQKRCQRIGWRSLKECCGLGWVICDGLALKGTRCSGQNVETPTEERGEFSGWRYIEGLGFHELENSHSGFLKGSCITLSNSCIEKLSHLFCERGWLFKWKIFRKETQYHCHRYVKGLCSIEEKWKGKDLGVEPPLIKISVTAPPPHPTPPTPGGTNIVSRVMLQQLGLSSRFTF